MLFKPLNPWSIVMAARADWDKWCAFVHFSPSPHLATSCQWLEISHGGSIYITEIRYYNSEFFLIYCFVDCLDQCLKNFGLWNKSSPDYFCIFRELGVLFYFLKVVTANKQAKKKKTHRKRIWHRCIWSVKPKIFTVWFWMKTFLAAWPVLSTVMEKVLIIRGKLKTFSCL